MSHGLPHPESVLPPISFEKQTLPNGLDVIVRRQATLPLTAVNLWYHVGSKDEHRRQRGFAHLFEHLMFEGSEHFPGDFFKPLQRLGADVNGSTSADRTNYYVDLPSAHLELVLAMESDRMANLLPALTESKLRIQKDVVKNEYRQNYANRPYGQAGRLLAEALYPPDHPYSWLTIGVMEDIEAATRDDVESFFQRFYVPANASLALVGDLDPDHALRLAERYFAPIPGGAPATRPWTPVAPPREPRHLLLYDRVELERIYLVWHTVPHFAPDDPPLTLAADLLARGRASRLYRRLVVELQLAQDLSAYHASRELAGSFGVVVTLRPGRDPAHARAIVSDELADLAAHGPNLEELDRVRNARLATFLYALDNIGGFGGVADRLNAYNIYLGDPARLHAESIRYLTTSEDQIRSAVARYLADHPAVTLTVRARPTTSFPPLDRSIRPTPAPARPFRAPLPEVRPLASGAVLWVIPRRDLPFLVGSAVIRAGASADGPRLAGCASLTAALLDEGTASRSAHQIALETERLGTSLSTAAGWDGSYVQLQCLSAHLDASLELAVDVLLNPSFPESEFARIHSQTLAALRAERDRAEALAHRALLQALYPHDHPYHHPADGSVSTVSQIQIDDLRAFHARHALPTATAWIFAGDVDPDLLARRLDALLSTWSPVPPPPPATPGSPPPLHQLRVLLIDRPGAAQAVARIGHVGIHRSHPDHDALLFWNQILGGQFSSRLNARLREEKGLTYGIRSHFDTRRGPGPFSIAASLQADRLHEALSAIHAETSNLLAEHPPTPSEIDDARRSLIEGQARHFETPAALVARYATLFLHDLPLDEHARLPDRLHALDIPSLLEASRRHVHPESFVYALVADADQVQPALESLAWAPIQRLHAASLIPGQP
ncbi:MAG: peptidase M16 [Isosphaeraceae bacterium]|jgi:predicted Zn-dependent peptidase|nr:MAG: peptidase M16 [Isosphaeraceae bacterium]